MNSKELAYQIAKNAFADKKDKSGKPYLHHLERVARPFRDDNMMYCIAILHDLLEDCPEWNEKSLRHLFSKSIVDTVVVLTNGKNEPYEKYIERISESSWATKVKLSDLRDNMDITRLPSLNDKDFERLNKYLKAYKFLGSE